MDWTMLRDAVAMVWRNLSAAPRVSVAPLLLVLVASTLAPGPIGVDPGRLGGWILLQLLVGLLAFA